MRGLPTSLTPLVVLAFPLLALAEASCADTGPLEPPNTNTCESDADCDDATFCTGTERCVETAGGSRICVVGADPCPGQLCDEPADRCVADCGMNPDADSDGHDSVACGGDDCDDGDANAYPGNPEVCDALGHDEDCNPDTIGDDADSDLFASNACCQDTVNGLVCGEDCDDARSGVNPGATEACNLLDDDCDGRIDENVQLTFYRDVDGDGFGIDTDTQMGCSPTTGYALNSGDCRDDVGGINPGAADGPSVGCDGTDNDCDGTPDVGCTCTDGMMLPCGPTTSGGVPITAGICSQGQQSCIGGNWGSCVGGTFPENSDLCANGLDDDCDGVSDEGCACGSGCACAGVSLATRATLTFEDTAPTVVYAGYEFTYLGPNAMGQPRMRVRCASNTSMVFSASHPLTGQPLNGSGNHEIWFSSISAGPVRASIDIFVIRQ